VFKEPEEYTNPESVKREHGVVEKCNFCVSRIDNGLKPACVENCPNTAMVFGDINDPESEISRLIATKNPRRIRPDLGSKPKVYYIGL
jgi:molybdopterin-containing oxidoreductase family iron-sulfur binding subunit